MIKLPSVGPRKTNSTIGLCLLMVAMVFSISGCNIKKVTQIIYSTDSGSIQPELQMVEEFAISREAVSLDRRGKVENTQILEGQWDFLPDTELIKDLFDLAEKNRCQDYKRVEPADPPVGAGTQTITLVYEDDESCVLSYDPGTTYQGAEELLNAIRLVLENLVRAPSATIE